MTAIAESFFQVVFGAECGLASPLLVEYGRSRGGYTPDEVRAMLYHKLRAIFANAERYGVLPGIQFELSPEPTMTKYADGYYYFNADAIAVRFPVLPSHQGTSLVEGPH